MKKEDFLFYLKKHLKGELPPEKVKYYIQYYQKYINDEIKSGRDIKDVLDELGDPQLIAKSIIESERMSGGGVNDADYQDYVNQQYEESGKRAAKQVKIEGTLGLIVFVLFAILLIAVVFKIISFLLYLLAPVVLVVIVVMIIKFLLKR